MTRPSQPRIPVTSGQEPGDLMTDHIHGERMSGDPVEDFLKRRKKATINDVASLAQVSKKTVSRVINKSPSVRGETRDLVNDIIARIGFRPDPQARGLAFRKSFLIGLIYDNPNAQYIVNMQMGALDGLRGSGNELVVHPCDWKSEDFLEEIRDFVELQRLSGVVILPPVAEDLNLLALLDELDVPFIRVTARDGADNSPQIPGLQIVSRDRVGCEQAGNHLVELGHRRIAFIAGNELYPSAHERRAGFEQGLAKHGLSFAVVESGDYSFDSGFAAATKILNLPDRPTALICCNDDMAAGARKVAYEMGLRVPEDLTIVGFDDAPIASRINPGLTTVRLPTRDMARAAAEKLIGADPKPGASLIFDSVLIVRGSSGPAPK